MRTAFLALVKLMQRRLGSLGQSAAVGESGALLGERRYLSFLELQRIELTNLITQQFESGVAITRLALQLHRPVHQLQPHAVCDTHLARDRLEPPIAVQQLALRRATHQ